MPMNDRLSYRFYNLWLARATVEGMLDASGQVRSAVQSLCCKLQQRNDRTSASRRLLNTLIPQSMSGMPGVCRPDGGVPSEKAGGWKVLRVGIHAGKGLGLASPAPKRRSRARFPSVLALRFIGPVPWSCTMERQ
jgi:hypothetical protein